MGSDLCNVDSPIIRALRDEWIENVWLKFVKEFAKIKNYKIRWIIRNPNISLDFIEKHPEFDWNYYEISDNPNITFDFVQKCGIDKPWCWYALSRHENITCRYKSKCINGRHIRSWIFHEFTQS